MRSEWKRVPLGDLVGYISKGIAPTYADKESETTVRVLNQKCNRNFRISYSEARLHDLAQKKVGSERYVRSGDILINSTGVGTSGRIAQIDSVPCDTIVDGHMIIVRTNGAVTQKYLGYALKVHQQEVLQLDEGSTGQTELNRERLLDEILVSYPVERETQEKIVFCLEGIEKKIFTNEQINDNLQQQARAIYKEWFIDFGSTSGTTPSTWKHGKLKDVLQLHKRAIKSGANTTLPYLPIDTIPMQSFGVTEFRPNDEAKSSLITFQKDDIIVGAMRVYFHRVVLAPCDGITRTTCFTLSPYNSKYLSYALLTCDLDSSIDHAQNTSKGSTMPYAVWDGGMGEIEIIIPPIDVAEEFNNSVLPMLRQIQRNCEEIQILGSLRDTLLPKLMSGEIDVSDVKL